MNLRDNKDGTCNCKPLGTDCFFFESFPNGRCNCDCHYDTHAGEKKRMLNRNKSNKK